MENKPLISVIIPIYNGQQYIQNIVENILSLNDNVELILINDNSTDNSEEVIKELIKHNKQIKYISNKTNLGVAKSRNVGLDNATGKYITFVDQDDKLVKGYKTFINKLEESSSDFIVSNFLINNKLYNINTKDYLCNKEDILDLKKTLLSKQFLNINNKEININSSIWNIIFKREFIENNNLRLFSYTSYEDDWILLLESLSKTNKVYLTNDSYYNWSVHKASQSHKAKYIDNYYNKRLLLEEHIYSTLKDLNLTDKEKNDFILYTKKKTFLWSFYNECNNDLKDIDDLMNKYSLNQINEFKNVSSIPEKLIINLLINKKYILAKLLQTKIFRYIYL